jgi:aminoglycoside 3-N-acetyltransferase
VIGLDELIAGLQELGIDPDQPVIAHASLSSFGEVSGGAETLVNALLLAFRSVVMPVFTYKTMLIPESGPPNNGLVYGSARDANRMAEFFHPDMPADRLMGVVPETLRRRPPALRSTHPILSFTGINAEHALQAQTINEPFAPLHALAQDQGWVLLLGVDHTVNTSIHYAERLSGCRNFTRWALTHEGVQACPNFPGCSDGFQSILPYLIHATRGVAIGQAWVQAVPLIELVVAVQTALADDPHALLCSRPDCQRCNAIRTH